MKHIPVLLNDVLKTLGVCSPSVGDCLGECQDEVVSNSEHKARNYLSLPYNPELAGRAKALRKACSLPEALFWKEIKNKKINGLGFNRQKIIGNYIVDFFCASNNLVIEIDDRESPEWKDAYDAKRDNYLKSLGLTIIRIPAIDVLKNMVSVIAHLVNHPAASLTQSRVRVRVPHPQKRREPECFKSQLLAGRTIIDCTFGAGGYTRAFLERGANVIAFDRDPTVILDADKIALAYPGRFQFINKPFSEIGNVLTSTPSLLRSGPPLSDQGEFKVDAIIFDLGISSMQIDNGDRGFSFRFDGPLDMRMSGIARYTQCGKWKMESRIKDKDCNITAAELIEILSTDELAQLLHDYGDIKNPRGLAQKIKDTAPQTTFELKGLIGNPKDVAPVFQALRIAVNDEVGQIQTALNAVPALLNPGGMCVCVTFHSLEDRIVKNIFREWTTTPGDPRIPVSAAACDMGAAPCAAPFKLLKTITPAPSELEKNPRARSAHLRAVQKV